MTATQGEKEPVAPVVLRWSTRAIDAEAIQRASYAMARSISTEVTTVGEEWEVRLFVRGTGERDDLAHRFRQEVVDQTLRLAIARRTEPVRNLVFALAFSRLGDATGSGAT